MNRWGDRDDHSDSVRRRLLSAGGAVGVSLLILLGLSLAQKAEVDEPVTPLEDLRAVYVPDPPPPPPRIGKVSTPPELIFHLAESPSDSPIQFAASPPAVESYAPPTAVPDFTFASELFKPMSDSIEFSVDHVFRKSEVDQSPVPIYQKPPVLPPGILAGVEDPRLTLMFVVKGDGTVDLVRLLRSANDAVDAVVIDAIKAWRFKPAVRNGKRVSCWVQQPFFVTRTGQTDQSFGDFR